MADVCLFQWTIAALNILLKIIFVAASTDFCASVYEIQVGKRIDEFVS